MPPFTQANRPLRLTTPLGTDALRLERIRGEERVSALFHFHLDLLSEKPDRDPKSILGQKVSVEIDFAGETRHINGIIARFSQGDRGMRLTRYQAELVPQLWLGGLMQNSRIFQQKNVSDVLNTILGAVGTENALQL